jgi:hypothetical protein
MANVIKNRIFRLKKQNEERKRIQSICPTPGTVGMKKLGSPVKKTRECMHEAAA